MQDILIEFFASIVEALLSSGTKQSQISGKNSNNFQSDGNINLVISNQPDARFPNNEDLIP